jgi:hypothetical protein
VKIGRHTFDLKKLQPMTLGDMVALEGLGIDVKNLEGMSPTDLVRFVHHFVAKGNNEITTDDVSTLPTGAVRVFMERLNAEADKDFLSD